jgi:hypothetical protein
LPDTVEVVLAIAADSNQTSVTKQTLTALLDAARAGEEPHD